MIGVVNELMSIWSFALRELRMWRAYRANQLMWVVDIFVNALLFFIVILAMMSVVFLPVGFFRYARGVEKARREGTLTRWQ